MRNALLATVAVVAIAAGVWAIASYNQNNVPSSDYTTISPAAGDENTTAYSNATNEPAATDTMEAKTDEMKADASNAADEARAKAEQAGDYLQANWDQLKGNVKQQWGKLTDDDVTVMNGRKDELSGKIQERYGISKEEADKQVDEWLAGLQPAPASTEPAAAE